MPRVVVAVGIVYVYRLWDSRRASVVLHLLYVSFSVGAALAPYLARPFTDDAYAAATMTYLQQVGTVRYCFSIEINAKSQLGNSTLCAKLRFGLVQTVRFQLLYCKF